MYKVIGVAIGLIVNHCIIKPIERKIIRGKNIEDGLVPKTKYEQERRAWTE